MTYSGAMINLILTAFVLVALTVAIHALGLAYLIQRLRLNATGRPLTFWAMTWQLVGVVWGLIMAHVLEITLWAGFYWQWALFPDAEQAFYFSGVTYATIGYGDLVLPPPWRIFSTIEGLIGILMCSFSGAFLVAVFTKQMMARQKS